MGTLNVPKSTEVIDVKTDAGKLQQKANKANELAYSMLCMAVTDPVSFGAVYNGKMEELPDGEAHSAWTKLNIIYQSKTDEKKNELEEEFNQSSLIKYNRNPDLWFAELDKLHLQL